MKDRGWQLGVLSELCRKLFNLSIGVQKMASSDSPGEHIMGESGAFGLDPVLSWVFCLK